MTTMTREERIASALDALRDKNGRLTRRAVVDAARSPEHPLHPEFEWDDSVAADKHRLDRAGELIRYVTVVRVVHSEKHTVPFYVRDPTIPKSHSGSIAITSKEINESAAQRIVLDELDRVESSIERARAVAAGLEDRIPGIMTDLEKMLAIVVESRSRFHPVSEAAE